MNTFREVFGGMTFVSKKTGFSLILTGTLILVPQFTVESGTDPAHDWQILETRHVLIQYRSPEDLGKFSDRIGFPHQSPQRGAPSPSVPANDVQGKVDALFARIQALLGVKGDMKRPIIRIFPNRGALEEAYSTMCSSWVSCYNRSSPSKAWYVYQNNTIHVAADDIHERILAHEMAHAVLYHLLGSIPPERAAEMIARRVESHLFGAYTGGE